VKQTITCGQNGAFDLPTFKYSYCMTRDSTSTGIIDQFHPAV
jgi:hypothetical protein